VRMGLWPIVYTVKNPQSTIAMLILLMLAVPLQNLKQRK
jgi:hypothetical protein